MVSVTPKAEPRDSANNSNTTSLAMQPDTGMTDESRERRSLSARVWTRVFSRLFAELSPQELSWLLLPAKHTPLLSRRRATMIGSRVLFIASLFAILTPLWIVVDFLTLPRPLWIGLAVGRMLATIGFVVLVIAYARPASHRGGTPFPGNSVRRTTRLLPIQPFSSPPLPAHRTVRDGDVRIRFPALGTGGRSGHLPADAGRKRGRRERGSHRSRFSPCWRVGTTFDPAAFAVALWLFAIIATAGILAGLSQLAFMMALVRDAIRDPLTGIFSRHSGEELLELQFINSVRTATPLSVAFIDLDHFKSINDDLWP